MKNLVITAVAILTLAGMARAQGGINLAWNDCGSFGASASSFTCDTNSGTRQLFVSFTPPVDFAQVVETEVVVYLVTDEPVLSPWWSLQSGGCRSGFVQDDNFTAGPFNCTDPWQGQATSASQYVYQYHGIPNQARIPMITALPAAAAVSLTTEHEYYDVRLNINFANTVGANACSGCFDGVCFVLVSLALIQNQGNGQLVIANPLQSTMATFQSGTPICPASTPARAPTWGGVKALYR